MARPNKTDEALLVSILEKYYADVACGNARDIRFTDLAKYAGRQGVPAKEYEFRRNRGVRRRGLPGPEPMHCWYIKALMLTAWSGPARIFRI